MKKSLLFLSLALASGGAVSPTFSKVQAAESSAQRAGRAAIAAAYKQQCQALMRKDISGMMSFYAPDFQMHSKGGQVYNRAETDTMLRRSMSIMNGMPGVVVNYSQLATRILSVTWRGKDAIVMCQTTGVAIAKKGARSVRTETVSLGRDYWTPTAQGWKIRQTAERETKMWLDGQRIG